MSTKISKSYFDLPEAELRNLDSLSLYEKQLLSRIIQTLRLGVYMSQKRNGVAAPLDPTLPGLAECEAYIRSAFSSDMASDKLFPLRHTGSSMQFILKHLPVPGPADSITLSAIDIFQLCIWRTFAFGSCDRFLEIKLKESDKGPDFKSLTSTIQGWGKGPFKLPVPAYGQLQIIKAKIPSMLASFWDLSQTISSSLTSKNSAPTFANLHNLLVGKEISSVPKYGLIPWLLVSDFFEYSLCQPPTIHDLAEHITNSQASGPSKAIKLIAQETDESAPANADDLEKVLDAVFRVLQSPPKGCPTIEKLALECKEIQGRDLGVVDLEHALCKISRQNSRIMASQRKTARVGDEAAKSKKRRAREEDEVNGNDGADDHKLGERELREDARDQKQVDPHIKIKEPAVKKRKMMEAHDWTLKGQL